MKVILPLANVGGQLGVRAAGNDNRELVAEVRRLNEKIDALRAERSRDAKADQAQRAAIYSETAARLDGSNERLDTIKRKVAR